MKNIELIAPVKKPEDIEIIENYTSCRKFYVYHKKFMENKDVIIAKPDYMESGKGIRNFNNL